MLRHRAECLSPRILSVSALNLLIYLERTIMILYFLEDSCGS